MKPCPRFRWLRTRWGWWDCLMGSTWVGNVVWGRREYLAESTEADECYLPRRWMAKRFVERAASEAWYREQIRVAAMNEEERMQYDREQERLRAMGDEVAAYFKGKKR